MYVFDDAFHRLVMHGVAKMFSLSRSSTTLIQHLLSSWLHSRVVFDTLRGPGLHKQSSKLFLFPRAVSYPHNLFYSVLILYWNGIGTPSSKRALP